MIVSTHESSQVKIISIKNGKKNLKASIFEDRPLKRNVQLRDFFIFFETIYSVLLARYLDTM